MLKIDYKLSDKFPIDRSHLKKSDEMDLRYDFFLGDIILTDGNGDFSTDWGWITLLDFALCLRLISGEIQPGNIEEFEFTESDDTIHFELANEIVHITCSYRDGEVIAKLSELRNASETLMKKLRENLLELYPELNNNESFLKVIDEHSTDIKGSPFTA